MDQSASVKVELAPQHCSGLSMSPTLGGAAPYLSPIHRSRRKKENPMSIAWITGLRGDEPASKNRKIAPQVPASKPTPKGHDPNRLDAKPLVSPPVLSPAPSEDGLLSPPSTTSPSPSTLRIASPGSPTQTRNKRRKRWCSVCQGLFSNLATHRSTHLAANVRPHVCEECGRGFARPNDLLRHQRSHSGAAAFVCPYYVEGDVAACHQTGRFSRCDTYKNHLKAVHFEYPLGTRKRERHGMKGQCKECEQSFVTADTWITKHIETGDCSKFKRYDEKPDTF